MTQEWLYPNKCQGCLYLGELGMKLCQYCNRCDKDAPEDLYTTNSTVLSILIPKQQLITLIKQKREHLSTLSDMTQEPVDLLANEFYQKGQCAIIDWLLELYDSE